MMTSNRFASGRTKEETHVTSGSTLYNRETGSKMSTSRRDGRQVLLVAKPYSQNALMNQIIRDSEEGTATAKEVTVI